MKAQKGFTLVELVVVIAILGVLAAVAVPRVNEFLRSATEQSYTADLAIIQSAVSAWYSDLHNDPFLGSRQYPIIGRNETSQDGRITRGEEGVEGVDEVGPFDHKDDGFPLAPTDAAGPDWNPLGGSQGADLLHVGQDGTTAWNDDGDGIREPGEDTWTTVEVSFRGHAYFVDARYYFLDMQALMDAGWLQKVPASASNDNIPGGTGSYTFYIDHEGKVQTLFAHFPMIQGFVQDIQEPGEPIPTPNIPGNSRPTASVTSPADGSTFPSSSSITFTGTGLDSEDGQLSGNSLVWTSSINGQIGIGSTLDASLGDGDHIITLKAKDSAGAFGTASINVSVNSPTPFNSRPVASISAPAANQTFLTSDSITFTGSAFDAQDGQLSGNSLVWSSNIDGPIGIGDSFIASLSAGNQIITLWATDSQGDNGTATVSITVNEAPTNTAPTASINIPDDVFVYLTTDIISFAGTGSDAEDGSLSGLSLVWTSDLDGTIGDGQSISVSLNAGIHLITLAATDSQGATGNESISITVNSPPGNDAPTASINIPDDVFDYLTTDTINFTGTGSDPEDGELTGSSLVWRSSLAGQMGTGTSISVSLGGGNHTITLTATDSLGASGSHSIALTVNTPPTASITDPDDGFTFLTTETINFNGSGLDAEDGVLTGALMVWSSNLAGQIGTGTSISVSLGAGAHIITLTATDSQGVSATASIETIVNNPPSASINIPDDVFTFLTTDTINFAGTGSDAEEGNLTGSSLVWSSNLAGQIGTGTSINVSLGAGVHTITLTATDNLRASGSESINVTVTPPADVEVTFQRGDEKGAVSETDDAEIDSNHDDDNSGNSRSLTVDAGPHIHTVLKFPNIFGNEAGQIPFGSTINGATLTLHVSNTTNENPTVYRIIEAWTEDEVTWSERRDDDDWGNEGADGTESREATAVGRFPMTRSGFQSLDVTASLRSWSNGQLNEGWVFIDNSDNGADFHSSETRKREERPKLTVTYTPP